MGNGWFGRAVMPLMCVLCVRLGVGRHHGDWLVLMSLVLVQRSWPAVQPKEQTECGSRVLFDTQDIDSCDGKTQRLLGDSVPKCALECNEKYVKPQRPRHILKFELARLGD